MQHGRLCIRSVGRENAVLPNTSKNSKWERQFFDIMLRISLVLCCVVCPTYFLKSLLQPLEDGPPWFFLLGSILSILGVWSTHKIGWAADYSDQIYKIGFAFSAFNFASLTIRALLDPAHRIYEPYESLFGLAVSMICLGVYLKFFSKNRR